MNESQIRAATPDDMLRIIEFQIAMAWETEQVRLDRETVGHGVRAVFDEPSKGIFYVAEIQEQVVATMLTVPEWSEWRNATVLWIHSVYVSESARRRGVFRTMYEYQRKLVEGSVEYSGLRLYVDKTNDRARNVYQSLGMTNDHYEMFEWMKEV